jgi:hypothetical protein
MVSAPLGQRRGHFFELCATPDCPNMSRWIPISHVPTMPQPFEYYCPNCCDRIDEESRHPQHGPQPVGDPDARRKSMDVKDKMTTMAAMERELRRAIGLTEQPWGLVTHEENLAHARKSGADGLDSQWSGCSSIWELPPDAAGRPRLLLQVTVRRDSSFPAQSRYEAQVWGGIDRGWVQVVSRVDWPQGMAEPGVGYGYVGGARIWSADATAHRLLIAQDLLGVSL